MKDLLLITPPFTQLNTPYPATAYLKGFLNTKNIGAFQMDLGIEVILELFSKEGLTAIFENATQNLNSKTQIPNSKQAPKSPIPNPKTARPQPASLGLGRWNLFGIWDLEFIPAPRFLLTP